MAESTKNMTVGAGSASASVTATVTDQMPGVPCPATPGYTYTGMRYVPVFADPPEWSSANSYEPLEIVLHEGDSYTSKTMVPTGIDISNSQYWVKTGNFNAQLHSIDEKLATLVKNGKFVNVKDFGAVGNGIADDTKAIGEAIKECMSTGKTLFIPMGTFKVSASIPFMNSYDKSTVNVAFLIENHDGFNVECMGSITADMSTNPTVFAFSNCSNVTMRGIHYTNGIMNYSTENILHGYCLVLFDKCVSCRVNDCILENVGSLVHMFNSKNMVVSGNTCVFNNPSKAPFGAYVAAYICDSTVISENSFYGATRDGDVIAYGSGTNNTRIIGNYLYAMSKARNFNIGQGICVDAGTDNTTVSDNVLSDYYYGIDVKNGATGCTVVGNSVNKCVYGIACRPGEGVAIPSIAPVISSNTVITGGQPNNPAIQNINVIDSSKDVPIYCAGFLLDRCPGALVSTNTVLSDSSEPFIGFYVLNGQSNKTNTMTMQVSGNTVIYHRVIAATSVDSSGVAFWLNRCDYTSVRDNSVTMSNVNTYPFFADNVKFLEVEGNSTYGYVSTVPHFVVDTCTYSDFTANKSTGNTGGNYFSVKNSDKCSFKTNATNGSNTYHYSFEDCKNMILSGNACIKPGYTMASSNVKEPSLCAVGNTVIGVASGVAIRYTDGTAAGTEQANIFVAEGV